jgi:hypothetical protein
MSIDQTTRTPSPPQTTPRFPLTLAVLGAVCSALATGVLDRLDVGTTGKLIGLAAGAALPPFVAVAGRWQHVRVAAALVLTGVAVVLSYSGWQIVANVSGTPPVVPSIRQVIDELSPGSNGQPGAIEQVEGDLGIRVSPGSIGCDGSGTCTEVTVTSTGTGLLTITGIEVEDGDPTGPLPSGCENAQLVQGQSCTVTLSAAEGVEPASRSTRLVIHQNFRGPATYVPLVVQGDGAELPDLAVEPVACELSAGDPDPTTGEVSGVLTVDAEVGWNGAADPPTVSTTVTVDDLEWKTFDVDPADGGIHVTDYYEGPPPDDIAITVDADGQVAESDESNTAVCRLS